MLQFHQSSDCGNSGAVGHVLPSVNANWSYGTSDYEAGLKAHNEAEKGVTEMEEYVLLSIGIGRRNRGE